MAMRAGNRGPSVWLQCRERGVAAITYRPLADVDLSQYPEGEPKELWDELPNACKGFLHRVVYNMKPGDVIYVKEGNEIAGKGTVMGPYHFDYDRNIVAPGDEDIPFVHQVPVDWELDFRPLSILLGSEPSTVLELTGERLRRLEEAIEKVGKTTGEEAYILTWNPRRGTVPWNEDDYEAVVRDTKKGKPVSTCWSCGNTKSIKPGDRVFFLRQGSDRGLIAAGYASCKPYSEPHWDRSRKRKHALFVHWRCEAVVRVRDRLPTETLKETLREVPWDNIVASGIRVHGAPHTLVMSQKRGRARSGKKPESHG